MSVREGIGRFVSYKREKPTTSTALFWLVALGRGSWLVALGRGSWLVALGRGSWLVALGSCLSCRRECGMALIFARLLWSYTKVRLIFCLIDLFAWANLLLYTSKQIGLRFLFFQSIILIVLGALWLSINSFWLLFISLLARL